MVLGRDKVEWELLTVVSTHLVWRGYDSPILTITLFWVILTQALALMYFKFDLDSCIYEGVFYS